MKHIHAPGKCNKAMSSKLKKHTARRADDEDEFDEEAADDIVVDDDAADMPSDPRWDALKGLVENDNN